MDLNWSDNSPPNILSLGEKMTALEKELSAMDCPFPDGYSDSESIFEKVVFEELPFDSIMPQYQEIFEYCTESESLDQKKVNEFYENLVQLLSIKEENSPEKTEEDVLQEKIVIQVPSEEDDEALKNYSSEILDSLENLDGLIPNITQTKGDSALLNELFRGYHTIKGASGFFGLSHITKITHELENVLDRGRKGTLDMDDEVMSLLLKGNDWLKVQFKFLGDALAQLEIPGEFEMNSQGMGPIHYGSLAILSRPESSLEMAEIASHEEQKEAVIKVPLKELDSFLNNVGSLLNLSHTLKHSEYLLKKNHMAAEDCQWFADHFLSLEHRSENLQKNIMLLRQVKIEQLLKKIPKIVFQLGQTLGKQVQVEMSGEDIGVDKNILDVLEDPLVHILRNSMDHGVESPEARSAAGKNPIGTIKIDVKEDSQKIRIVIKDDGGGIDAERVAEKAVEKGAIKAEALLEMSSQEKLELIFLPGFSTTTETSQISGRGVGMDVVRSAIQSSGGNVLIQSSLGHGTILDLWLPKLAALSARIVFKLQCSGIWFSIPLSIIDYLYYFEREKYSHLHSGSMELFNHRLENLPVIHLSDVLGLEKNKELSHDRSMIVIDSHLGKFILEVDQLDGFETLVIQDIPEDHFSDTHFEGASVLGDGSLCFLLSLESIVSTLDIHTKKTIDDSKTSVEKEEGESTVLIFHPTDNAITISVDLECVARIESFDSEKMERMMSSRYYKSSMGLLPYFDFQDLGIDRFKELRDADKVLLVQLGDKKIALGVIEIVDVISLSVTDLGPLHITGISGSWSFEEKLVGILDMSYLHEKTLGREQKLLSLV